MRAHKHFDSSTAIVPELRILYMTRKIKLVNRTVYHYIKPDDDFSSASCLRFFCDSRAFFFFGCVAATSFTGPLPILVFLGFCFCFGVCFFCCGLFCLAPATPPCSLCFTICCTPVLSRQRRTVMRRPASLVPWHLSAFLTLRQSAKSTNAARWSPFSTVRHCVTRQRFDSKCSIMVCFDVSNCERERAGRGVSGQVIRK